MRVQHLDGTLEPPVAVGALIGESDELLDEIGTTFSLPDGRWVRVLGFELESDGSIRYGVVGELPKIDGEGSLDVLTGHGSGRFQWIDVRPEPVRNAAPANADAALPLAQLLAGSCLPYGRDVSLAVFGQGLEDTQRAVEELRRRGYREVLAMSGERYGGYEWLVHVHLVEP